MALDLVSQNLRSFRTSYRALRPRTMREFAESEIVIPTGRPEWIGLKYRVDRQPLTRFFFDAVESNRYSEFVAVGPSQSTKTLTFFVIPIMYHLFELGDTIIIGLPEMDLAKDKFTRDLLPVIEATRYRDLMPRIGGGSRGGFPELLTFRHGAAIKWMSGGGSDKHRAGFETHVLALTESNGLDARSGQSKEASKIMQLKARMRMHHHKDRRIYDECTVLDETCHIWRRHLHGTGSRLALWCVHCQRHVEPQLDVKDDLEHSLALAKAWKKQLAGWQEATTEMQAEQMAYYACPQCGQTWSEHDRRTGVEQAALVHRTQRVAPSGIIVGDEPKTRIFGFHWQAVHNVFLNAGDIAIDEYEAAHAAEESDAIRAVHQFTWAIPFDNPDIDRRELNYRKLLVRPDTPKNTKGRAPDETKHLVMGVDVGKRLLHWVSLAVLEDDRRHVCDYGVVEVPSDDLGTTVALTSAFNAMHEELVLPGIRSLNAVKHIEEVWIDARWQGDNEDEARPVFDFIRNTDPYLYRPTQGKGTGQFKQGRYLAPGKLSSTTPWIGVGCHLDYRAGIGLYMVEVNSDYWKGKVHDGFRVPPMANGGITLFHSTDRNQHLSFLMHITAEHAEDKFVPGKGVERVFVRTRRSNHYLDALALAMCAASYVEDRKEQSNV